MYCKSITGLNVVVQVYRCQRNVVQEVDLREKKSDVVVLRLPPPYGTQLR